MKILIIVVLWTHKLLTNITTQIMSIVQYENYLVHGLEYSACLFIYGLFEKDVSSSDYVVSNGSK
jgi:hypothetical protein